MGAILMISGLVPTVTSIEPCCSINSRLFGHVFCADVFVRFVYVSD
jgi:hypothetical protein